MNFNYLFHYRKRQIKYYFFKRIETLPRVGINLWQYLQLYRVVQEAYANVPFYGNLFKNRGILPYHIKNSSDIRLLPIVDKQSFRKHPIEKIINSKFAKDQYSWGATSGSTNIPFIFPRSRNFQLGKIFFDDPYCWQGQDTYSDRFLLWRGVPAKRISDNLRVAQIRSAVRQAHGKYYLFIPISDIRDNASKVLSRLFLFKPHILEGRASVLAELANASRKFSLQSVPRIPFVISSGEVLTRAMRDIIQRAFSSEVYNLYGLEETGAVGVECAKHNGFHIFEESFIVEILDEYNNPVPAGRTGKVIVTHFFNDILPFIRYDTGDYGTIVDGSCACGIRSKRIEVIGRYGSFIELNSKKYHSVEFEVALRRFCSEISRYQSFCSGILGYQFVKKNNGILELNLEVTKEIPSGEISELQNFFERNLSIRIVPKIVTSLRKISSGKTKTFIDETAKH